MGTKRMPQMPQFARPFWYWVRAEYYDMKQGRQEQAFSGPFVSEAEASQWAIRRFSTMPGADYKVLKSKSRDRTVARNELRNQMVEANEGDVAEVLNVRFRNPRDGG
jgi:hypothetical protein